MTTKQSPRSSKDKAVLALRIGLGVLFFWFGLTKFISPDYWLSFVPAWAGFAANNASMYAQGAVEALVGLALLAGWHTRKAALAAALVTGAILISLTFNQTAIEHFAAPHIDPHVFSYVLNDIFVRDLALLAAALALYWIGTPEQG